MQPTLVNLNRKISRLNDHRIVHTIKGRMRKLNKQVAKTMTLGIWKLVQVGNIFMLLSEG